MISGKEETDMVELKRIQRGSSYDVVQMSFI